MLYFKDTIIEELDCKHELVYLKLEETPTSYTEWLAEDNE
jgi:hypothetical protein